MKQVDALFSRVLHYFDRIVVSGPQAHHYVDVISDADDTDLKNLVEHIAVLLYLRHVGAEDLLVFVQKPPACVVHYMQHAREAGVLSVVEKTDTWIDELQESGEVQGLEEHQDHWHFAFVHPDLEHTVWGVVFPSDADEGPTKRDVIEAVVARYAAHLVSDVVAAKQLGVPLGAAVQLHERVLAQEPATPTVEDVAFALKLPVLQDVPIPDLIRIREDEHECFEAFRQAIQLAIRERLTDGAGSVAVAREVERDVIAPALLAIDRRLHAAKRALGRKAATSIAVGAVLAAVGLLEAAPLILGTGVAGATSTLPALHKYLDDRSDVELSDMYFLWKVREKGDGWPHH